MEQPVKRKRGRPRKMQLPEEIQKIVEEVKEIKSCKRDVWRCSLAINKGNS